MTTQNQRDFIELFTDIRINGEDGAIARCVHNPAPGGFLFDGIYYRMLQFFCDHRHVDQFSPRTMISIVACKFLPNKTHTLFGCMFVLDQNNCLFKAKSCDGSCGLFTKETDMLCSECELQHKVREEIHEYLAYKPNLKLLNENDQRLVNSVMTRSY
jgi:hypothetical protein